MQIRWSDVGYTEQAGDYEVRDQIMQVDSRNIDIWKQHPTAVFDVAWVPGLQPRARAALILSFAVVSAPLWQ
jgi:hypothetical protein